METFRAIDVDFSGMITPDELKTTFDKLELLNQRSSEDVVQQIMFTMDFDQNGTLNFSEFLSGTLEPSVHLSENNLKSLFCYLDPF